MHRTYKWKRLWYWLGALGVGIVWYLSLMPAPPELPVEQGDKLQHLAAYGSLGFWFSMLAGARCTRVGTALGLSAMGVALEFLQRMTGYRSFDYVDMLANACGALIGTMLGATTLGSLLYVIERNLEVIAE